MSKFELNKIVGAILFAILLVTAIRLIGNGLFESKEEATPPQTAKQEPAKPEAAQPAAPPAEAAKTEAAGKESAAQAPAEAPAAAPSEKPAAEAPAAAPPAGEAPKAEAGAQPPAAAPPTAEAPKTEAGAQPPAAAPSTAEAPKTEAAAGPEGGDPAAGEKVFKAHLCFGCHKLEPGQNGAGPSLAGVYGRKAAQAPGFAYSDALKNSGITWTPDMLDKWVQGPKAVVADTKMVLVKPVADPTDRANLIAYLKQHSS